MRNVSRSFACIFEKLSLLLIPLMWLPLVTIMFDSWHGFAINSDLIQPLMLLPDLYLDPSSIYAWSHSAAPYVFPDWIIAGLVVLIPVHPAWWVVMYGVIVLTGYGLLSGWVLSILLNRPWPQMAWLSTMVLAVLGGLLWLSGPPPVGTVFIWLASPFVHGGAVLCLVLSFALLLGALNRGHSVLWLLLVVYISSFSDLFFIVWFALPAAVWLCLRWLGGHGFQNVRLAVGVIASAALGAITLRQIRSEIGQPYGEIIPAIRNGAAIVWDSIAQGDIVALILCIALPVMVVRAAWLVVAMLVRRRELSAPANFEILLAGSATAIVSAPLAAGWANELGDVRYIIAMLIVVALWFAILLARLVQQRARFVPITATGLTLLAAVPITSAASGPAHTLNSPMPLQNCIEEQNLTDGYGDYWTAKWLMMRSNYALHFAQLTAAGDPFLINFNRRWFTTRIYEPTKTIRPNFISMARLDPKSIEERFGTPSRVVRCDSLNYLWIYDEPLPLLSVDNG